MKCYAIHSGYDKTKNKEIHDKIVYTWDECTLYVKGVKGAQYKKVNDEVDAHRYFDNFKSALTSTNVVIPNDILVIYVDGSYNDTTGEYAYGFTVIKNNVVLFLESGKGIPTDISNVRQVEGELKAAIKSIEYAINHHEKEIYLYYDYAGIEKHINGEWERKSESSKKYYNQIQELTKFNIKINFVKSEAHSGEFFNELCDKMCKHQLNINSDKKVESWLDKNTLYVKNAYVKNILDDLLPSKSDKIVIIKDENKINSCEGKTIANDSEMLHDILSLYKKDIIKGSLMIDRLTPNKKTELIIELLKKSIN